MSLFGGWVLAPLVLAALVAGCGLLAERLSGERLPGLLIPPLGLAAVVVVAGIPALWDATAKLAAPLAAIAAAAGFALAQPWGDPRLRALWPWPLLLALGAYAVYAMPSLLTGQGSITGYVKLDDSATWLALTDHVLEHGRDRSMVPPGSYARTLEAWLGGDYPVGAFLPLGVAAKLAGVDPAAAYQAAIALYAAVLALGLAACARALVTARWAAAAAAFVAVQASLLFGYANWGGIKEVMAAALLAPLAWLAASSRLVPLALVAGATVGVLGPNGLAWAGPALLVGVIRGRRRLLPALGVLVVAAIPALLTLDFLRHTTSGAISAQDDLGNLVEPPPLLQGFGLWPVGDLRLDPPSEPLAVALALACLVAAAAAAWRAARRGRWELPVLLGVTLAGALAGVAVGSPWVDAKALAVLSPVVLLGAAALVAAAPAPAAAAGATALALATGWSTVLVARDVFVAPRERLGELRALEPDVVGPAVVLDFEIYAQRHFLRAHGTDGATDLRQRRVAKADGQLFPTLSVAEVDLVAPAELWAFRSIVRRRNPSASRPPAAFELVRATPSWELWRRPAGAPVPLARLPLARGLEPAATPDCARVRALSRTPGARELAAARGPQAVFAEPAGGPLVPSRDGSVRTPVKVPAAGAWRVYVGGVTLGRLEVRVDGEPVGSKRHELSHAGQYLRFGSVTLQPGDHTIELRYSAGFPMTGIGSPSPLGPLALVQERPAEIVRVAPGRYRELCGRPLDWVEALQ